MAARDGKLGRYDDAAFILLGLLGVFYAVVKSESLDSLVTWGPWEGLRSGIMLFDVVLALGFGALIALRAAALLRAVRASAARRTAPIPTYALGSTLSRTMALLGSVVGAALATAAHFALTHQVHMTEAMGHMQRMTREYDMILGRPSLFAVVLLDFIVSAIAIRAVMGPVLTIGVDGVHVEKDGTLFVPWSSISVKDTTITLQHVSRPATTLRVDASADADTHAAAKEILVHLERRKLLAEAAARVSQSRRSFAEWKRALARLADSAEGYRENNVRVSVEDLASVASSPAASRDERLGAAMVLARIGDDDAKTALRSLAVRVADDDTGAVLEALAAGEDPTDEQLASALRD